MADLQERKCVNKRKYYFYGLHVSWKNAGERRFSFRISGDDKEEDICIFRLLFSWQEEKGENTNITSFHIDFIKIR